LTDWCRYRGILPSIHVELPSPISVPDHPVSYYTMFCMCIFVGSF